MATAWQRLNADELAFVAGEIDECINSRMHYLENYHAIVTERGQLMGLSPLWDLQLLMEEAIQRDIAAKGWSKTIDLKGRQTGGTEYANGVMCHCTFFTPYAYTMTVAQDPATAAHVQRKVKIAWQNLPWWLRPDMIYTTKGEYLEFNKDDNTGLGSVFVTTHSQRSSGVAIGKTIRFLHLTEVSRWASGEIYTADIEPSMNAPDTIAIAESTALGDSNFFARLWQEAVEGESDWTPVFLPAYRARKFSLPIDSKQRPFILTPLEIATRERVKEEENFVVTDEFFNWRRRRIKSSIKRTGFPYAHLESYPTHPREAFQSSGFQILPRHKLDEQQQACIRRPRAIGEIVYQGMGARPKLFMEATQPGQAMEKRELEKRFYLWEDLQQGEQYYIGVDVGDGILGGDFSVAEVLRAGKGAAPDIQVAEWVGYAQPVEFAKIVYAIGQLYGRCEIAVEYAREGVTTANYLANDLEYPNLYRPRSRDRIGNQLARFLHWSTTMKTKVLLKSTMSETLLENGVVVRSQYLLDELYKLVRIGSSWGGLGSHDDAAVAVMIALFCLRETMPDLRAPVDVGDAANLSPTSSARLTGGGTLYGIYDKFFRLLGQTADMQKALDTINANPGLRMKPIVVSKANTAWSPIYHGTGAERQLLKEGMESRDILPNVIELWKGAQPPRGSDAEGLNSLAAGDDMGWGAE